MTDYQFPMFERLEPRTQWQGGRATDTDVLTLSDAASMATPHAGQTVSVGDILRAAGRGEIALRAIVHRTEKVQKHDGGVYCNGGTANENTVPAGAIPTLPLTACKALAATGRASWRTFDDFEIVDGELCRFTKGLLIDGEPDFETVPDDCRVTGNDIHALADAFKPIQATPVTAPEAAVSLPDALVGELKKPAQRFAVQEAAILDAIREPGYDPMELPKNAPGKPGVKAAIRANLVGKNPVFPKDGSQFEKAWDRLRSNGEIADKS